MLQILQSLALELEGTGVLVQEIDPGVVNTEMTKVAVLVNVFLVSTFL